MLYYTCRETATSSTTPVYNKTQRNSLGTQALTVRASHNET